MQWLQRRSIYAFGIALMLCLGAAVTPAQSKRMKDAARHSSDAAKVFREIMGAPDQGIPRDLLDRAEAIVVFPGVKKAAFIVGGSGGQGVVSRRAGRSWRTTTARPASRTSRWWRRRASSPSPKRCPSRHWRRSGARW